MKNAVRLLAAALAALACAAYAQNYPTKPVRLVISFTPGSSTDIIGRAVAAKLQEVWGQPVVAENRPGAGGTVGSEFVVRSDPDGYTLLANSSAHAANPGMYKELRYDTMRDFVNLALLGGGPNVLIVSPESGWKSLKDFVDAAKKNPGKINYSSSGVYGTLHVAMEIFANAAGIKLFHVPYQGGGPALTALLGGQVHALASGPAPAAAQMKGGKVRALASWSTERLPLLPDVPTFKELGYDAEFYIWSGVFAPAATPAPVLDRLRSAVREAATSAEFKSAMEKVQTPVSYLDAPAFRSYWEKDAARLKIALEKIGKVADK